MPILRPYPSKLAQDLLFSGLAKYLDHHLKNYKDLKNQYFGNNPLFKQELATLKVSLPRGSGNTLLGLRLLSSVRNSVYICKRAQNLVPLMKRTRSRKFAVLATQFKGKIYDVVFIDCNPLTKEELKKLYEINSKLYVFIG